MSDCVLETTGHVSCKDRDGPCKFYIKNKTKTKLVRQIIDGCLVSNDAEFKRCDFGVYSDETYWLIELKGGDFTDAVEQLISTIRNTEIVPCDIKITPVIITTRSPLAAQKHKHLGRLARFLGERWSGRVELGTKNLYLTV